MLRMMHENRSAPPWFDWVFIVLGGLPFFLPFVLFMGESGLSRTSPVYWYFWVNAVISAPHVYSTYWRLGRKIHEGRVSWAVGIPAYAGIVGILMLASVKGFYLQALTAVNVWQSVHYLRQVYGVSRLYTGTPLADERIRKSSYAAFHLAMPLFVLGRWDTLYRVWSGRPSEAIIPVQFSDSIMAGCWGLAGVAVALGVYSEIRRYRRFREAYDPAPAAILLMYFIVHFFGFLSIRYYQRGFFAVTIFHAIQYLSLVWVLERKHSKAWILKVLKAPPYFLSFFIFWGGIFGMGYVFEHYLLPGTRTLWPLLATVGLSAVSAHHYFVDTFIWRRRSGL